MADLPLKILKTITSVSGGRTSAYVAKNYPTDHLLFALVRTDDPTCRFKDDVLRKEVEQRIQNDFNGTLEDDLIITTMLDLEQYLGQKINWVTGPTYDWVIANRGGWLPNKLHRYCTTAMKIEPMFYWWAKEIIDPIIMQIGYRANEVSRANKMLARCNADGFIMQEATFEKWEGGTYHNKNKWEHVSWQRPVFPLIDDNIYKDEITKFWQDKPVRFADYNNCVGCFHRNSYFLKKMFTLHPDKMAWFRNQEGGDKAFWKSDVSYAAIEKFNLQGDLFAEKMSECDDGFCEIE